MGKKLNLTSQSSLDRGSPSDSRATVVVNGAEPGHNPLLIEALLRTSWMRPCRFIYEMSQSSLDRGSPSDDDFGLTTYSPSDKVTILS